MTSRNWAFTLNNYTGEDVELFKAIDCKYIIFGKEVGKEGTPHLQGQIIMHNACRLPAMKRLHPATHWEITKCLKASIKYCGKDGDTFELDKRVQGKRTDLEACIEILKTKGLPALKNEIPETYVKFHSGFDKLAVHYVKDRDPNDPPIVTWIWGPAGCGKTRQVVEKHKSLWMSGKTLRWWDGYENQEAVLIDDFRKDFCTYHELLRILDRYPYTVEIKGGTRKLTSKYIYITSCYSPEELFKDRMESKDNIKQLMRRITTVTEVNTTKKVTIQSDTEVGLGNTTLRVLSPFDIGYD
nr:MAG: replication associated protein [Cressdnaviricota sp.]